MNNARCLHAYRRWNKIYGTHVFSSFIAIEPVHIAKRVHMCEMTHFVNRVGTSKLLYTENLRLLFRSQRKSKDYVYGKREYNSTLQKLSTIWNVKIKQIWINVLLHNEETYVNIYIVINSHG